VATVSPSPSNAKAGSTTSKGLHELPGPARLALSFVVLIGVGTVLLALPFCATEGRLSLLQALFTATSAVCVTGLSTISVASDLSRAGQIVLLVLIQLGALGFTTMSTLFLLAAGRTTLADHVGVQDQWAAVRMKPLRLLWWVLATVIVAEVLGVIALRFCNEGGAAFPAIFHGISAFCNAGFSLHEDSLMGWQNSSGSLLTIMTLIMAGGLGFIVWRQLFLWGGSRIRGNRSRLILHSKVVLSASAVLWIGGLLMFLASEWGRTLEGQSLGRKLLNSAFQSVTTRTAGFHSMDFSQMREGTLFLTMFWMLIGAAPGGVAGGVKVTTAVVILATMWARLRSSEHVFVFKRTIPPEIVRRAFQLVALALAFLTLVVLLLLFTEEGLAPRPGRQDHFLMLAFEAVSAFGTVGLSTGITAELSVSGQLLIVICMFAGRIGPLAFALAIFRPQRMLDIEYPHEPLATG
jgi:trk system potassium uptake protein TrkH